jgi:glutamate-1-semialdehyde 2,1-aminomutase
MKKCDLGLKNGIKASDELYARAKQVIGSGTNTFSRAPGVFPDGAAPKFLSHQDGCHVWDVDGNEYIDMVMGCGPVTLGHRYPEIDTAIRDQLDKGILFSMLHPLEVEVAEKLVDCIPFAEMVKFSKNGSDVCAAAVRLARHVTGRSKVFCWGYHGFHDWYVASTDRAAGIPEEIKNLTKTFEYGDIEALETELSKHSGEVAAIIMEPVIGQKPICHPSTSESSPSCRNRRGSCSNCPQRNFLKNVKEIAEKNGALLIFDEMISGFRFSMGGAGQYFGVSPDLATFGKGITNGMPLGVLVGKAEYMRHFDKVFLSSTYAPETLTLAAASKNIDLYIKHDVIDALWDKGEYITDRFQKTIDKHGLKRNISLAGYPVRLMVNTHDEAGTQDPKLASLYQQEMFKNGVLCFSGVLMLSYSHHKHDLDSLVDAFDKTCQAISDFFDSGKVIDDVLECKPGAPVFKGLRERNAVSN